MEIPHLTVGDILLIQKALDVYRTRAAASEGPKIGALIKKLDLLEIRSGEERDDRDEDHEQDLHQEVNGELKSNADSDADVDALLEKFNKLSSGKAPKNGTKGRTKNSNYDKDVDALLERFNSFR